MNVSVTRRGIALAVVLGLVGSMSSIAVPASGAPALSGRVLAGEPFSPRSGVTVALTTGPGEPEWSSEPSGPDGEFRVDDVPDGTYTILVHDGERAFIAADRFVVPPEDGRPVLLALQPELAPAATSGPNEGEIPRWGQWLIGGAVVVVGAFVINEALEGDSEPPGTPF